jgi:hypothetical protein
MPTVPFVLTVPESVVNLTTQLISAVLLPALGLQPGVMNLPMTIMALPGSSPAPAIASDGTSATTSRSAVANVTMHIGSGGATLQIVGGGVRLPADIADLNE